MKEMFRSFRIFTGNYTIKNVLQLILVFCAIFGAMSLVNMIEVPEDSFAAGFFASFVPAFSMFIPLSGGFMLNAIYSYNMQITPGYKYLHSIPSSKKSYVQAILAGNLAAFLVMLLAMGLQILLFSIFQIGASPIFSAVISLLAIGIINLLGNTKRQWLRMVLLMPVFILAGGLFGYSAAMIEDGERIPDIILWIALGVSAAVYIIGLIYTLTSSAKKWRRSE